MRTRLKKQQHQDPTSVTATPAQAKSLTHVRPMENTLNLPPVAPVEDSQNQQLQDEQSFNFAEIPIFAGGTENSAPTVQAKFFQGDRFGNITQQPVQREEGEEEEPVQGKLEPVQREEGEEEEPVQGKLEPVQREEGEEEEPVQGKLEPVQREEGEEEEPVQGKLEPVQREEGEDDEPVQGKLEPVQREEGEDDEPAQAKGESEQVKATQPKINLAPSGSGKVMPEPVQEKMETAFGADFSGVRIHEGPQAKAINAVAYTQGENIHFQPGKYQPETQSGQELLGHELTHVVQQKAGRVTVPQGKGAPINADSGLESEADILGTKAARGESVEVAGVNSPRGKFGAVQAKTQALTTKNNIFFKQTLHNSKSDRVVQQKGNTFHHNAIQCKMQNLNELSEGEGGVVTKSSWWKLSTGSENIQKSIKIYNNIKPDDKNYSNQRKILTEIISLSKNWLKTHSHIHSRHKDWYRYEAIAKVAMAAELELSQVEKQEQEKHEDKENNYEQRSDDTIGDIGNVAGSVRKGLPTLVSQQTLTEGATELGTKIGLDRIGLHKTFGKGVNKALGGDGQSLGFQTTNFLEAIQESTDSHKSLLDENNSGTKSLVENYRLVSGLTTKAADGNIGPKIMSLGETLGSWSFIGSVVGLLKSLYDAYSVWGEWQAFANAQKEIKENERNGQGVVASLKDAVEHGYGKIKRRFWGVITTVIAKVLDIVSYILTATGVGAAVGAIMKLATTILNTLDALVHKIKGIYKFATMQRGKHRAQSADTLVQNALNGDKMSLQILVSIDPLGAIGRAKMGAKLGWDFAKERNKGKAISVGTGVAIGVFSDVFKAETPEEMHKLLLGIKKNPEKCNININEFTTAVAEKLKSQS